MPVPTDVATATVELRDPRRFQVPVTLVCPEFSPEDARDRIESGDVPELARAQRVEYVDIDSGHWPMITCPDVMARVIHESLVV